ncbi:hypothetical protein OIU76_000111 [Salix suchowensis]|nr:hypothetical protein OIU76_000111 [Salix suchowensis]
MAVEAPHTSLNFPSHLLTNRDFVKVNQANMSLYNTQMDSGLVFNEPMPETLLSFYQSSLGCDPVSAKASNKDDSGLTYNKTKVSPLPSFIDQEIIFQIQQQQSETDRLIAEHNQKVIMELEDRRKRQSRMLANEATANSLRSNLEQVLAHVSEDRYVNGGRATVEDDAESSCGSSDYGRCPLGRRRRGCGEG